MNKIYIMIDGGLGSQMTKIAAGLAIQKKANANIFFDILFYDHNPNHHNGLEVATLFKTSDLKFSRFNQYTTLIELKSKRLPNFLSKKIHKITQFFKNMKSFRFKESISDPFSMNEIIKLIKSTNNNLYFESHWLNFTDYIREIDNEIQNLFQFNINTLNKSSFILHNRIINSSNKVYISIHIRRGDYFKSPENRSFWVDICSDGYYERAIPIMNEKFPNAIYLIFSDDLEWSKKNIQLPENAIYVDWNKGADSWQDMYLMSICQHNITANSSFSMWGAILNTNKDKTILTPKKWIYNIPNKIVPETWIKI